MQGPWMEWLMLVDEIRGQRLVQKMEEEEEVSVKSRMRANLNLRNCLD